MLGGLVKELSRRTLCNGSILIVICAVIVCYSQIAACPMGYYGNGCRLSCSRRCLTMECHNVTGTCFDGCQDGYHGDTCENECNKGFYGSNCTLACVDSCLNNKCHHVTGDCLEECAAGLHGPRCDQACRKGSYGAGCKLSCPPNCAGADCDAKSGYCMQGCRGAYWGSDCNLKGEFKENPEGKKRLFYKHLSPESRSVLLYVLMADYDKTLQRAQAEIEAGMELRRELKTLIG